MDIINKIFEEIHDVYESWDGGQIRLDMTSEDLIKEAITKAINYSRCCEQLPTKKEIIFDDSLMAEIETTDNNLKVLRAVNGWGVPVNIANVQINDK